MTKYFSNDATDVAGYMGISKERKEIYVVFRGSHTIVNWLFNLYAVMTTIPWRRTCFGLAQPTVHEGFLLSYESVSEEIVSHVSYLVQKNPDYKIVVVGHSLGGALATICAMELNEMLSFSKNIRLVSYASPRVGNEEFVELVAKHFPDPYNRVRVTNGNDIVSHIPPYVMGFHQSAREIFIPPGSKQASLAFECDPSNGEDPRCANAYIGYSVEDHLYFPWGLYFGSPCNP